jgi:hypothetical protein
MGDYNGGEGPRAGGQGTGGNWAGMGNYGGFGDGLGGADPGNPEMGGGAARAAGLAAADPGNSAYGGSGGGASAPASPSPSPLAGLLAQAFAQAPPGFKDPNQRAFGDVAFNGLHVGPSGWVGGTRPSTGMGPGDLHTAGFYDAASYLDPASREYADAYGPDTSDPLGIGLSATSLKRIGLGIGTVAGSLINPALGMAVAGLGGLGMGQNPGGVAGGMGAGMVSPIFTALLAGAGPAGQIAAPVVSQAVNWGGRQLGSMAYNAGYSAPANQGPNALGGGVLGGGGDAQPQPAGLPTSVPPTAAPPSAAPRMVSNVNPLRSLLLALGQRGGVNIPLLLGGSQGRVA